MQSFQGEGERGGLAVKTARLLIVDITHAANASVWIEKVCTSAEFVASIQKGISFCCDESDA